MHLMWLFCHLLACCVTVWGLCCSTVCSLCYVFDTVCSMILSTRHTDDINLPYLDHVARRPPLIRHFTTLSSQRDREMRDVYFEKRWTSHRVVCGLLTVSVLSYVIYLNAQEEKIIYLLHHKGFLCHFVIFLHIYWKVKDLYAILSGFLCFRTVYLNCHRNLFSKPV